MFVLQTLYVNDEVLLLLQTLYVNDEVLLYLYLYVFIADTLC